MTAANTNTIESNLEPLHVGIIGGGVAGSTIAIRLAALGVQTTLFEKQPSLVDGPPMCHLHAGGNLYREIPDADCVALLKQSIDMLRLYPYSIDVRPTLIAIPTYDSGNPQDLLPRLSLLTKVYQELIATDPANEVLGPAKDYFRLYNRTDLERLRQSASPQSAKVQSDRHVPTGVETTVTTVDTDVWVTAAAKRLDLDALKYPVVAVSEYGWNIFRLAASAQRALSHYPKAQVLLSTKVTSVQQTSTGEWQVTYVSMPQNELSDTTNQQGKPHDTAQPQTLEVDYLINACGFRTGFIDNMVGIAAKRMVEFKASYIAHWEDWIDYGNTDSDNTDADNTKEINNENDTNTQNHDQQMVNCSDTMDYLKMPEIIIHGERGTPQGMVQLTPYPNGYYQIHNMSKEVTLFDDGLVSSTANSAQPELKPTYLHFIEEGWDKTTLLQRGQRAIDQVSKFVPQFASARPTENALYGGQQIPGNNDTLRVADVSIYPEKRYARAENVKASSALLASDEIVAKLTQQGLIQANKEQQQARQQHQWRYLGHTTKKDIDVSAAHLATIRRYPPAMAGVVTPFDVENFE